MGIEIRKYTHSDLADMRMIWNGVVEEGNSFPQVAAMNYDEAERFFAEQSHTGVAVNDDELVGLYILHPNNIGRCGHIANASYAVKTSHRGMHIGERLVRDSMTAALSLSFKIIQFNAVVATNTGAVHLYKKLGFTPLGVIPGGFKLNDGSFVDIIPFYITLTQQK